MRPLAAKRQIQNSEARWRGAGDVRLDRVDNPFGLCPAALEALETSSQIATGESTRSLQTRIAGRYRLAAERVSVIDGVDAAIDRITHGRAGPIVTFSPSSLADRLASDAKTHEIVHMTRGPGSFGALVPELACDLPPTSIAVVASPSDPLGAILSAVDGVRLARACRLLIVDERLAEFSGFSLLPLALEFDNIVVIRSFVACSGLDASKLGWLVTSSEWRELAAPSEVLPPAAVNAALATLNDQPALDSTLRLVREERSRLFRLLRKFAFLRPLPSWGPFLATRVEGVPRGEFVDALAARGIRVHVPGQPGLEQYVRIGVGIRADMEALRQALLDLAPEMMELSLRLGGPGADRFALSGEERVETECGEIDHVFEVTSPERASLRR